MLLRFSDFGGQRLGNSFSLIHEFQRELDRLFKQDFGLSNWGGLSLVEPVAATNLYDKGDHLLLVSQVPGLSQEDLELEANAKGITVSGTRPEAELPEGAQARRLERRSLSFKRSFSWPVAVDVDSIEASLKDGVLQIKVAKAPEAQPRNIEIKAS